MRKASIPQDSSNSDTIIAQEDGRWLLRANDGQFFMRDADDNMELLSTEEAQKLYKELPDQKVAFEVVFGDAKE